MKKNSQPVSGGIRSVNEKALVSKKRSWGKRYWLPLAGMLILTLSFAAMSSIWKNVQDMEAKRYREHDELARSIGETAKTFW